MFDNFETETHGVDVEKRAQAYQQKHPDAPDWAVKTAVRADVLKARVEAEEKRRQKEREVREELEAKVENLEERLNTVAKAITGSAPSTSGDGDDRAAERAAIEKEHEVFTR